ncbi:MAG: phosphotransferase [Anaerolineae bacterium]|nr:phosphotransferase [Anaerolineae bacterium]
MTNQEQRPALCEVLIRDALQCWGFSATPLEISDLGGAFNGNWRVALPEGELVVRVRPRWLTLDRLRDVQEIMCRLPEVGVPTAVPLLALAGRRFEQVNGRIVEVFHYLPEEANRHWSSERWAESFAHLGRLHRALAALQVQPVAPSGEQLCPAAPGAAQVGAHSGLFAGHAPPATIRAKPLPSRVPPKRGWSA